MLTANNNDLQNNDLQIIKIMHLRNLFLYRHLDLASPKIAEEHNFNKYCKDERDDFHLPTLITYDYTRGSF